MYRKNTAGQFVCVQMLLTASGAIATGLTPTVRRCIDGTFAAGGGTVTEDTGTGGYKYAMAQADTNGNDISLFFTATGAMPVCVNFVTTAADPTDGVRLGLTALPNAAAGANGGLPTGDAAGKVALQASQKVDVDTIKTNPVVNAGTITFPTGATLASTTNITAGIITTTTNLTNLPSIPANWLTATGIAAAALNGKGDWNVGKTGYTLTQTFPTNFSTMLIDGTGHVTFGNTVTVKKNAALAAFTFVMTDSTNHAPATGLTVTATRSLDGAAFAGCANAVTAVASGVYKIDLAATDLNASTIMLRFTATAADDLNILIVTQP